MIMKPEPIARALDALSMDGKPDRVILTDPQGEPFTQAVAMELARDQRAVILCGRYEGVDERVKEHLVTHLYSIGDYVVSGGELPALVMMDAIIRTLPGALGSEAAAEQDSFSDGLLDFPHYTRPREFRGWSVHDVLLNGNHADICEWRRLQQLLRTRELRPDLWARYQPTEHDRRLLDDARRGQIA